MAANEHESRVSQALADVTEAGYDLEQARMVLVRRAAVALAAGAGLVVVAKSAGVEPRTLRTWLTGWRTRRATSRGLQVVR